MTSPEDNLRPTPNAVAEKPLAVVAATPRAAAKPLTAEARAQMERLMDENRHLRAKAAEMLGRMGSAEAVAPLLAALGDAEPLVRSNAAEALGKIGDAQAVMPLCVALWDKSEYVRFAAAWALGRLGDARAVVPLCEALQHTDSTARASAAWALGSLGYTRSVAPLCALLQDGDGHVRSSAVRALGQIGNAEAFAPLCAALRDADWSVRLTAVQALRRLGDVRAVEALCVALGEEHLSVLSAAAQALGKLGDVRAVLPLCVVFLSRSGVSNAEETVRDAAAAALWEIGKMPALPVRILASAALTPAQKLDALDALTQVVHPRRTPRGERALVARYPLGSAQAFCRNLCRGDAATTAATDVNATAADVRCGAEAVLAEVRNRADATILLRASVRDDVREKQELLRGAFGQTGATFPNELLRASDTEVASETNRTAARLDPHRAAPRATLLARLFRRK